MEILGIGYIITCTCGMCFYQFLPELFVALRDCQCVRESSLADEIMHVLFPGV